MQNYDAGLDILGCGGGYVVGHGGGHGGGGRGRGRGYGGGWGGYYDGDDGGDTYVTNYFLSDDGDEVLGMFDFNVEQRRMDSLQQFPETIAQSLLVAGQAAIDGAIAGAKQPWYRSDLTGATSRQGVQARLQQEAITVASLVNTPNAPYPSPDTLKSAVLAAFREANAVSEGAAYLDTAWSKMWAEIGAKIAALPKQFADKISEAMPGYLKWGLGAGAGLLVLIGGFVAYKKLT